MAKVVGIEPTSQGFGDPRITSFPHRHEMANLMGQAGALPIELQVH